MTPAAGAGASVLERLLASREIVIVCGAGGVGKTTTAATAALMAATRLGGRVLVVTVDPARRLAQSLGIDGFGDEPRRVDPGALAAATGSEPRGELWVAMLDTKASWDRLVSRHSPDDRTRDAILSNPLYTNITAKFVHSHDYIAMERLHELHQSGEYDLIVVDTPPSRHALDFLEAPERMAEFFDSRLLRWLTIPARSRLVGAASRSFGVVAERTLGTQFLGDIAEFFLLFRSMYPGFVERAEAVQRTIRTRRTSFVVVSTLESSAVSEISWFVDALAQRRLHLGGVVLNRVLPDGLRDPAAEASARQLAERATEIGVEVRSTHSADDVSRVLCELAESFLAYRVPASREAELRSELRVDPAIQVAVPILAGEVADISGLVRIGGFLW
ncbi:MAG: ArsA-related P-loop ATPase [Acidimicrobiales bacterium]